MRMKDIQSGIFMCLIFFACSKNPVQQTGITLLNPTSEHFDPNYHFQLSIHLEDDDALKSYYVEITNANDIPLFIDEGRLNHFEFDLNYNIDLTLTNQESLEVYITTIDSASQASELKKTFYTMD